MHCHGQCVDSSNVQGLNINNIFAFNFAEKTLLRRDKVLHIGIFLKSKYSLKNCLKVFNVYKFILQSKTKILPTPSKEHFPN
jgi:hypothetical protein